MIVRKKVKFTGDTVRLRGVLVETNDEYERTLEQFCSMGRNSNSFQRVCGKIQFHRKSSVKSLLGQE